MFDLFRSRDKIVRIMLGGLLLVVALSMLTYLVPSYNMGGGASDDVIAQVGKETITVPEVQQIVQMNMRVAARCPRTDAALRPAVHQLHDYRARAGP